MGEREEGEREWGNEIGKSGSERGDRVGKRD